MSDFTQQHRLPPSIAHRAVGPIRPVPGLLGGEDRGLAGLDDVLRSPDRARGVEGQDLADDEPVEEHPQRREVLLRKYQEVWGQSAMVNLCAAIGWGGSTRLRPLNPTPDPGCRGRLTPRILVLPR